MKKEIKKLFDDLAAIEPYIDMPRQRQRVADFLDLVMKSVYFKDKIRITKHEKRYIVRLKDAKLVYEMGAIPRIVSVIHISRETRKKGED